VQYLKDFFNSPVVHFYRNVFKYVTRGKIRDVVAMLKAIHSQEDRKEAVKKAKSVVEKLKEMKLGKAAKVVGAFPDGKSALMLVAARLRHLAGTKCGSIRYMKMERFSRQDLDTTFTVRVSESILI